MDTVELELHVAEGNLIVRKGGKVVRQYGPGECGIRSGGSDGVITVTIPIGEEDRFLDRIATPVPVGAFPRSTPRVSETL